MKNLLSLRRQITRIKINAALSTAAATAPLRLLNDTDPATWEFTGFSQNGEDGVIDFLTRRIISPTRHFMEIGSSDGLENNTSWLVFPRRFSGLMVEGNPRKAKIAQLTGPGRRPGVSCLSLLVNLDNLDVIRSLNAVENLDVLSVPERTPFAALLRRICGLMALSNRTPWIDVSYGRAKRRQFVSRRPEQVYSVVSERCARHRLPRQLLSTTRLSHRMEGTFRVH